MVHCRCEPLALEHPAVPPSPAATKARSEEGPSVKAGGPKGGQPCPEPPPQPQPSAPRLGFSGQTGQRSGSPLGSPAHPCRITDSATRRRGEDGWRGRLRNRAAAAASTRPHLKHRSSRTPTSGCARQTSGLRRARGGLSGSTSTGTEADRQRQRGGRDDHQQAIATGSTTARRAPSRQWRSPGRPSHGSTSSRHDEGNAPSRPRLTHLAS